MLPFELELEALRAAEPELRYRGGDFAAWQTEAREKLRATIERIINEGCNGLICIIL